MPKRPFGSSPASSRTMLLPVAILRRRGYRSVRSWGLFRAADLDAVLPSNVKSCRLCWYAAAPGDAFVNVVWGSYAACVDVLMCERCVAAEVRCHYCYDVAGVIPIARGRGLHLILVRPDGGQWESEDVPAYERVSFIIAREDVVESVVSL